MKTDWGGRLRGPPGYATGCLPINPALENIFILPEGRETNREA
jgi:hypothetical protein